MIRLDGAVDISSAAELKERLVDALETGSKSAPGAALHVDLGSVAELDVTWVQLVWSARREAERAGMKFSMTDPLPDRIRKALIETGFHQFAGPEPPL